VVWGGGGSGLEDWAWAKSGARRGSLGEVRVAVVVVVEEPWNWEVRSVCCLRRETRVSLREVALLLGGLLC
jgi:hypothetical protein